MPSTTNLRTEIANLLYNSVPQGKMDSELCTVGELRHFANSLAALLNKFADLIDEI